MKTGKYLKMTGMLLVLLPFFYACSEDDDFAEVDGLPPTITLSSANVKTEPGREFRIQAKVADKDGLHSIRLINQSLYLDKTIDLTLDSVIYAYDLDYKFKTESDITESEFPIQIVVTDLGGRMVEETLLVTMDGDFTAPVFTVAPDEAVTVLLKETTRLNLRFTVVDDKALDYVEISIPELNYSVMVTEFTNSGKTLSFSQSITLPNTTTSYTLKLKAVDKFALETITNSIVTVSEMPDFAKMYLVDVSDVSLLSSDLFGIPMLIERSAAYTYKAKYYSEKAGTEIRFAPQKTDFNPICFGLDPENNTRLTDDWEVSLPIVLPAKGYYEITLNVKTGTYSVSAYTPTDTPLAIGSPVLLDSSRPGEGSIPLEIGLVGAGIPNAGNWATDSPLVLKQDSSNPYLFSVEMTLEAGKEIEFIISAKHSWGWWPEPFWRWDRSNDPEANVMNGGENMAKLKVKTSGKYIFKFDTHLKRSKLYPAN